MSSVKGLEVNENFSKVINAATDPEAIKAALLVEAEAQGLTRTVGGAFIKDTTEEDAAKVAANAKVAADAKAADAAASPQVFSRTETINSREFTFEADSQAELDQMVLNAYRVATAITEVQSIEEVEDVDPAVLRAAEEAEVARKVDLDLRFRRGELTPTQYLEESGAMQDYLASQGVPVEALKKTIEAQELYAVEQSWGEAVEAFLKSPAGADWPGGDNNKDMIGLQLQSLGLMEATDKVAALAQAYNVMKQRNMIFQPNAPAIDAITARAAAEKAQQDAARFAAAQDEANRVAVLQRTQAQPTYRTQSTPSMRTQTQQSSSLWGTSSGTSANDLRDTSKDMIPASKLIPADARPEEILAAWKAAQVQNGQNPDAAFLETFKTKH